MPQWRTRQTDTLCDPSLIAPFRDNPASSDHCSNALSIRSKTGLSNSQQTFLLCGCHHQRKLAGHADKAPPEATMPIKLHVFGVICYAGYSSFSWLVSHAKVLRMQASLTAAPKVQSAFSSDTSMLPNFSKLGRILSLGPVMDMTRGRALMDELTGADIAVASGNTAPTAI